jgi:predicted DCC family thiol-disulfide oxidoreductase YuxK
METKPVILYDGNCNLCSWSMQFIIRRDYKNRFKYTSLQSTEGRKLAAEHGIQLETLDSFILIEGTQYFTQSSAAIRVSRHFSRWWSILSLLILIPKPIRDWGYDQIAKNRYKWFGQVNSCPMTFVEHFIWISRPKLK